MVPESWAVQKLGQWLVEHREKSVTQDQYVVLTSSRDGLIRQSDYYGEGRITKRDNIGFHVIPPDCFTYRSRSDDDLYFFNKNITGEYGIVSHFYPVFHFPDGDGDFFHYLMNYYRHRIGIYAVGSSQKVLSLKALRNVALPIPPLSEQKKIAEILSTWDKSIETSEKLLSNAEAQKRALMQQMLSGKRRLRGRASRWDKARLGDLGKWSGGGTPSKSNPVFWERGDVPWVSPKDMKSKKILDTEDHVTEAAVHQSAVSTYPSGSILIVTRSGILRREVPVAITMREVAVNQDIKALPPTPSISMEYLANVLWADNKRLLVECVKDGTTVESIDTSALMRFEILLPPLEEQIEIASMMSLLDEIIKAYEARVAMLRAEKRALMQQLLTGKRRVTV